MVDSTGSKIEDGVCIQLPDSSAMGALHIIGINLELGVRVYERLFGKNQILVRLFRIGLLRIETNDDPSIENTTGLSVENTFIQLVAVAVRFGMVNGGVIVNVLFSVNQIEAVERRFSTFAVQYCVHMVSHQ